MFGYVTADKPNMLIKDFALYKAYYCGVCKALGKRYNQLMRFSVNFDITFLALLAHNYQKFEPIINNEHCVAHPIGKAFPVVAYNNVMQTVADINVILAYYKVYDDVEDNGKFKYKAARAYLHGKYKKAANSYPLLATCVKENYMRLRQMEKSGQKNLDMLADCFACMLVEAGKTASTKLDDNLEELCYNLGRWIYFIDAYDDLQKDIRLKKFNPLIKSLPLNAEDEQEIHNVVEFNLMLAVQNIRDAYDKMDITVAEGPLSNVVYRGLASRTKTILERRGKECKKTLF